MISLNFSIYSFNRSDTGGSVFNHANAKRGRWKVRGIVNYASGNVFKGSWEPFTVGE